MRLFSTRLVLSAISVSRCFDYPTLMRWCYDDELFDDDFARVDVLCLPARRFHSVTPGGLMAYDALGYAASSKASARSFRRCYRRCRFRCLLARASQLAAGRRMAASSLQLGRRASISAAIGGHFAIYEGEYHDDGDGCARDDIRR